MVAIAEMNTLREPLQRSSERFTQCVHARKRWISAMSIRLIEKGFFYSILR